MVKAVLFDLFETLITESRTPPASVASRAPLLGCDRDAFRRLWKALRPSVITGRLSFGDALREITARLGRPAADHALQQLRDARIRDKAVPFQDIDRQLLIAIDCVRSLGIRLGVISNCLAEDVAAWPRSPLASRFDCTVFSFDVGMAKPDPGIYREAMRRLQVGASDTWFIGDGEHDELAGAEAAGLRAFRATWFLRRWPHFREEPGSVASLATAAELVRQVGPTDD